MENVGTHFLALLSTQDWGNDSAIREHPILRERTRREIDLELVIGANLTRDVMFAFSTRSYVGRDPTTFATLHHSHDLFSVSYSWLRIELDAHALQAPLPPGKCYSNPGPSSLDSSRSLSMEIPSIVSSTPHFRYSARQLSFGDLCHHFVRHE